MIGQYGFLMEGGEKRIGIERHTQPTFLARCHLCGYRSSLCEYEPDAQQLLDQHIKETSHRTRIQNRAVELVERELTAWAWEVR